MKRSLIIITILTLVLLCFVFSVTNKEEEGKINLRFNSNYRGDTVTKQKTGLLWALSYLGAELPKNSFEKALVHKEAGVYELDINRLGFNATAVKALKKIFNELKASEEYKMMGGIDLGAFIVYTAGSSWHYYEITGAAANFNEYRQRFDNDYKEVFPVVNSAVAKHHRLLKMRGSSEVQKMSFIAEEGSGDLAEGTFVAEAYEVFDIMKNGQLKFAIYDSKGELKAASEKKYGNAGKPIKCMWCHEIYIEPLFYNNEAVKNFISPAEFQEIVRIRMDTLKAYRARLNSDVDFTKTQDHTFMEILYMSFMEPSDYKLSQEWGKSEQYIGAQLGDLKRHAHREHLFLNKLVLRGSIKGLSPYVTVNLPDSVWEENNAEPDIFRK
ncbi:MAG TPA: hypothetical protein PL029_10430 [Bacteroidia bacterium]|mgnify:CR=1 FL=1|nr:hypothetical protein [Bacteroidia bacterium]